MLSEFIKKWGAKKLILAVSDLICVVISAVLALSLTTPAGLSVYIKDIELIEKVLIFLIGCFLIIPLFRYYQLYKHKYFLRVGEQTLLILKGLLINSIVITLLIFLVKTQETLHDSRAQVVIFFSSSLILLFVSRVLILRKFLRSNYIGGNIKEILTRRALAIGAGYLGEFFAEIPRRGRRSPPASSRTRDSSQPRGTSCATACCPSATSLPESPSRTTSAAMRSRWWSACRC